MLGFRSSTNEREAAPCVAVGEKEKRRLEKEYGEMDGKCPVVGLGLPPYCSANHIGKGVLKIPPCWEGRKESKRKSTQPADGAEREKSVFSWRRSVRSIPWSRKETEGGREGKRRGKRARSTITFYPPTRRVEQSLVKKDDGAKLRGTMCLCQEKASTRRGGDGGNGETRGDI